MNINLIPEYSAINPLETKEFYGLLTIEVPYQSSQEKPVVHVALVIDTSGSMAGESINKTKESVAYFVNWLTRKDHISLITFSTDAQVVIPHSKLHDKPYILKLIEGIEAEGTTNLSGGLLLGYKELESYLKEGEIFRVILFTDGMANEGITDTETLKKIVDEYYKKGITISTMGYGEEFDEELLVALSKEGGGNYFYIKNIEEIAKAFQAEFGAISKVIGQNLSINIDVPEGIEITECPVCEKYKNTKTGIELLLGDVKEGMDKAFLIKFRIKDPKLKNTKINIKGSYISIGEKIETHNIDENFSIGITEDRSIENEGIKEEIWLYKASYAKQKAIEEFNVGRIDKALEHLMGVLEDIKDIDIKKIAIKEEKEKIENLIEEIKNRSISSRRKKEIYQDAHSIFSRDFILKDTIPKYTIELTLTPMERELLEEFTKKIELELKLKGYPESKIEDIKTIIHELVYNALEHGCKDEDDEVKIYATIMNEFFKLVVEDPGDGFDFKKYLEKEYIPDKKDKGRGIHIVKSLATRLLYKGKGNIVEAIVRKKDTDISTELPEDNIHYRDDIVIVKPKGEINSITIGDLKNIIDKLTANGWSKIILDLSNVSYIDSSGIGLIIRTSYELGKYDGSLVLTNIKDRISQIFDLVKLGSFVKTFPSNEDALNYLSNL